MGVHRGSLALLLLLTGCTGIADLDSARSQLGYRIDHMRRTAANLTKALTKRSRAARELPAMLSDEVRRSSRLVGELTRALQNETRHASNLLDARALVRAEMAHLQKLPQLVREAVDSGGPLDERRRASRGISKLLELWVKEQKLPALGSKSPVPFRF